MIRTVALLLALAVAQPALAQTAPTPTPKPSPNKPSPAKPALKKPPPPKPDAGAPAATAQRGPCIGVIPHLRDRFAVQTIGLTAFGNDLKEVPIESWGLDDLVVARVRAAAGARIAVRRIAYPANAFEPFDNPPSRLFRNASKDLKGVVQAIAGTGGCERYVVVIEGRGQWVGTNQLLEGIGIANRGTFTYLFADTDLFVFDGHTFEVLKTGAGALDKEKIVPDPLVNAMLQTERVHGPNRELKELQRPNEPDAVFVWPPTQDKVMGLRDVTRALLAESLDNVLPKLLAQKSADEE
ncbi:MAG TPA: hypothetical protein VK591_20350 [Xanthobacteraceae bacterium]|nr:hypothetical protein [Xanthobacteraceae bacterium]